MTKLLGKVSVPEGKKNNISIEKFTVSENESLSSVFSHGFSRMVHPGEYTKLVINGRVVMSDTMAEVADHATPVRRAKGNCLIAGLGIGVVLQALLRKEIVEHVTVIEKNQDVIDLVEPHYKDLFGCDRFDIICADIFHWKSPKGMKYGMAWFDIWPSLCTDNLLEMHKLHRKFGRCAKWKGSWGREILEKKKRIEKKERRLYTGYSSPLM